MQSATIEKIADVVEVCFGPGAAKKLARVLHDMDVEQLCKTCHDTEHEKDRKKWGAKGGRKGRKGR
jgi:hypothetical protein